MRGRSVGGANPQSTRQRLRAVTLKAALAGHTDVFTRIPCAKSAKSHLDARAWLQGGYFTMPRVSQSDLDTALKSHPLYRCAPTAAFIPCDQGNHAAPAPASANAQPPAWPVATLIRLFADPCTVALKMACAGALELACMNRRRAPNLCARSTHTRRQRYLLGDTSRQAQTSGHTRRPAPNVHGARIQELVKVRHGDCALPRPRGHPRHDSDTVFMR